MNLKEKAQLYRDFAKLLGASFPINKGVLMLLGQQPSKSRRELLQGLDQGFAAGLGFAASMRTYNGSQAGSLELTLLEAGERSGHLGQACQHLADYFETAYKGVASARSAMVYPLILLHLGVILPEVPRFVIGAFNETDTHPGEAIVLRLVGFWVLLLAIFACWRWLSRTAVTSEPADRMLAALPIIGSTRQHWALARFCQVFNGALLASMRMTECIRLAGEASQSALLQAGATATALSLDQGHTLTEAIESSHRFPRHFVTSIATAEAAGGLDIEMGRWATAETEFAAEAQKNAANFYPKVLYFGVVMYVGYRVVSVFSDYYGSMMQLTK